MEVLGAVLEFGFLRHALLAGALAHERFLPIEEASALQGPGYLDGLRHVTAAPTNRDAAAGLETTARR